VSRRDDERVADILDAADEIGAVTELGRDAWDKDRIRRLAVERLLEISGLRVVLPTTITGSTRVRYGQSPPPRFPGSFRTFALKDERQPAAPVFHFAACPRPGTARPSVLGGARHGTGSGRLTAWQCRCDPAHP
jgi:hypothetical protein